VRSQEPRGARYQDAIDLSGICVMQGCQISICYCVFRYKCAASAF
jgi:hypothetical protein